MSKTSERKTTPDEHPIIARERQNLERETRIQLAADKAYRVFVDHGLNATEAGYVINRLQMNVENAKKNATLS